jgi:hypothetical protein
MQDGPRTDKSRKSHPPRREWAHTAGVSAEIPDPGPLDASLRALRRSALVAVALCAGGIALLALGSDAPQGGEVDRRVGVAALALAGASILTRRSLPRAERPRAFVALQVASVLCAVGLALLGALLAIRDAQWQIGLLYQLAAALLLLRPPARFPFAPLRRD